MKKVVRLTESNLIRIVNVILETQNQYEKKIKKTKLYKFLDDIIQIKSSSPDEGMGDKYLFINYDDKLDYDVRIHSWNKFNIISNLTYLITRYYLSKPMETELKNIQLLETGDDNIIPVIHDILGLLFKKTPILPTMDDVVNEWIDNSVDPKVIDEIIKSGDNNRIKKLIEFCKGNIKMYYDITNTDLLRDSIEKKLIRK